MRTYEVGPTVCSVVEDPELEQVTLKAHYIPGLLNVVADKLSRLGQAIRTVWYLLSEVFQLICARWHQPKIDLFATMFNNKLSNFVSPVPDPLTWAVDALSLSWEDLDPHALSPEGILSKKVAIFQDYTEADTGLSERGASQGMDISYLDIL